MKSIWKALKAIRYYVQETGWEEPNSEILHLMGHVETELRDLEEKFPKWIPGTGRDLGVNSYAYVHHPGIGVMFAQLTWHVETDSNGEHKWWTWTDYTKGIVVMSDEITHYIPLKIEPPTIDFVPEDVYATIWNILVEHGGANAGDQQTFIYAMVFTKTSEYRFCGHFGFGGKLWRDEGRFYVTFYPEDTTDSREDRRDRINFLLKSLTDVHRKV